MNTEEFLTEYVLGLSGIAVAIVLTFIIEPPAFWRTFKTRQSLKNLPLFWSGIIVSFAIISVLDIAFFLGYQRFAIGIMNFFTGLSLVSTFLYFYRVWAEKTSAPGVNTADTPNATQLRTRGIEIRLFRRALGQRSENERLQLWASFYNSGQVTTETYNQLRPLLFEERGNDIRQNE